MTLEQLEEKLRGREPGLMDASGQYAVLVPLVEREGKLHILYEVRSQDMRRQPGEVCFPGGRIEGDETPEACAIRETEEELSIPPSQVRLLGTPDFLCSQRGFLIRPFLGLVSPAGMAVMAPSPAEVAEVFTVPLAFFQETKPEIYTYDLLPQGPAEFPYEAVGVSPDYPWSHGRVEVPVWYWQGRAVWGMTARIVRHIVQEF